MITEENLKREYVTAKEASKILNVNDSRIRQICIEGKFEGAFKLADTWLIPYQAVKNYNRGKKGPKYKPSKSESDRKIYSDLLRNADNIRKEDSHDKF